MQDEQILQRLLERFGGEDADGGKIVVWYDEDAEFEAMLDEFAPELEERGIEVAREEEGGRFALKQRLNAWEASQGCLLLYRQRTRDDLKGDWFADLALYADAFSADFTSMTLRELRARETPELRRAVRRCRAALRKKTMVKRLQTLRDSYSTEDELLLALCAATLGKDAPAEPERVLVAFLARAYGEGAEAPLAELEKAGALPWFERFIQRGVGYTCDLTEVDGLLRHVLVSALAASIDPGKLGGLEGYISQRDVQRCLAVVRAWMALDREGYKSAARAVERACSVPERLSALPLADVAECSVFPCAVECVVLGLMRAAHTASDVADDALAVLRRCREVPWYEEVRCYGEGMVAFAQMSRFRRAHAGGFPADAQGLWCAYTSELYEMDTWYRMFHRQLSQALVSPNLVLDDAFKALAEDAERLYRGWFLRGLGEAWSAAIEADERELGYVREIPRQVDFFMAEVDGHARGKGRVFVIVSDALRFEVAAELAARLERETQGRCELRAMQGAFPSITPCGMAALLPHSTFHLEAGGGSVPAVLLDGKPCASTAERAAVLAARVPSGSCVLRTSDFKSMRRDERKAYIGDAQVVYLYHNVIDATGDSAKTEAQVFDACADALDELAGLVRTIVGELRCPNVLITADHGFLYGYEPLEAVDKLAASDAGGAEVAGGRRYSLREAGAESDVLMRVNMAGNGNAGLAGFTPRSCARIARPGAGERFVHGGLSLQEMCVPCLRFKNYRAGSKGFVEAEPVTLALLDTQRVVTNNLFTVRLFQREAVSGKRVAAAYRLYLADDTLAPVSDEHIVAADRTSGDERERVFKVRLCLKAGVKTAADRAYYLVTADAQTGQLVWKEPFRVEIAFSAVDDFAW